MLTVNILGHSKTAVTLDKSYLNSNTNLHAMTVLNTLTK